MLRSIKKKLLEIISSMEEACRELTKQPVRPESEELSLLLCQMQEAAISVGTTIEECEGGGTAAVEQLELFCDLLWELYQTEKMDSEASGPQSPKADEKPSLKKQKQLAGRIKECIDLVRKELAIFREQYKVVFIPYQASMWDSLESVWEAAAQDPDCISYVLPVPYYDKNADGSFGALHYEGDRFPSYVPITDYRYFDLEAQHPDIIYFHNPYDQENYVTSLHPSFYSDKLKKCTDMLVYIPYFVVLDDVDDHFCLLPGVMNADRVIVQSEKVQKTYIRCYTESLLREIAEGKTGLRNTPDKLIKYKKELEKMAKEKFLALGSPKFDKVKNTRREELTLPQEWKKKIWRADGSRRKVLLYNVTLDSILRYDEKMLKKIEAVFSIVQENEDVVLLWRPHPLIESTIRLMRPELCQKYCKLVSEYKKEDFGIFDDTPDVHCAIAVSDAYYGDGGSLVALYQASGKPIMYQSVGVVTE